jgi:hypothetical protein
MLRYIETRLKELEDEKEELKAYQELDRERRALEYTLYTKELQSTNETLRRVLTCPLARRSPQRRLLTAFFSLSLSLA